MKSCPACGLEVPKVAFRCKSCFHDFDGDADRPRTLFGGPLSLLLAAATIGVLAWGTFWYVSGMHTDERVLVDASSRTVQWVRSYKDGRLETDRVSFDEIASLKYEVDRGGESRIVTVTTSGDEKVVAVQASGSLQLQAQDYARLMGKRLEVIDHAAGALGGSPSATR